MPEANTIAGNTQPKFAFKRLPNFNPVHSRAWASVVRIAFAERNWQEYLVFSSTEIPSSSTSTPESSATIKLDSQDAIQANAFLLQPIPYEYRYGLEEHNTTADIFHVIETKYNSQSSYDEFRLETLLMNMRKAVNQIIDQHIDKFSPLMTSILANQNLQARYSNSRRN